MVVDALLLLLIYLSSAYYWFVGVDALSASSNNKSPPTKKKQVTLSVCTGADCRVDGSTDCLRLLQQQASRENENVVGIIKKAIRVKSRACVGPCGDGPIVLILDDEGKRVIETQPSRLPGSLAPPELFGDNPLGCYQVRTKEQLDFVMNLATKTAGIESTKTTLNNERGEEAITNDEAGVPIIVTSTRQWFDRPRNERKVLQRLVQFMVAAGLYNYQDMNNGEIGITQWQIAAVLAFLSNFIMKENFIESLASRMLRRRRK